MTANAPRPRHTVAVSTMPWGRFAECPAWQDGGVGPRPSRCARLRWARMFIKRDGRWQCVLYQSTKMAP